MAFPEQSKSKWTDIKDGVKHMVNKLVNNEEDLTTENFNAEDQQIPSHELNRDPELHGAHSGTRHGITDYNDGGNVTHYGGNDESYNFVEDAFSTTQSQPELEGKVALGNNLEPDKNEERQRDDQQHTMTEEEKLDEAIEESFPASDPPGHSPSKSFEDKTIH
jgi:hypothetical protein